MTRFPGRTLDELDSMDWGRYLRAMEAGNVEDIEDKRLSHINGKVKKLDADDWDAIREHDRMWAEMQEPAD